MTYSKNLLCLEGTISLAWIYVFFFFFFFDAVVLATELLGWHWRLCGLH